MIAISFQFLAGRYHATPWGRHVNEGAVEWPPSPWRILRALVATWKRTLPDLAITEVEPVIRSLLGLPEFFLPPASTGHARHFMPWFKKGPADRTLVFDTFVVVAREWDERNGGWSPTPLIVTWPDASLDAAGLGTLARILGNLNLLGRSESWVEAEIAVGSGDQACLKSRPLHGDVPPGHEIVRLLCPDPQSALTDDHVVTLTSKTAGRGKGRHTITEKTSVYDPAWNLCMETLQLHKERWSDPPGSRWVQYTRPRDCFKVELQSQHRRNGKRRTVNTVRYALDSAVLPLVTETLPVAEAARRALMSIHGRQTERDGVWGRSDVLSGKDEQGHPFDDHRHAYFLPTDEDGDGRLDHLTVCSAAGFGTEERRGLDLLRLIRTDRTGEDRHPLRVLLLGMGTRGEYAPSPLQSSAVWESVTPYIASRYAKTTGSRRIDLRDQEQCAVFLQSDLADIVAAVRPDLAAEGVTLVSIEPLWEDKVFKVRDHWRPIQFKRFRRKAGDDGGRRLAGSFRLTFSRPVHGPIALGWSSHFGMGLFMPAKSGS